MLSRFISKPSNLRFLALISSQGHPQNHKPFLPNYLISNQSLYIFPKTHHFYSTNHNDNNGKDSSSSTSHLWNLSSETDSSIDSIFGDDSGTIEGIHDTDQFKDGSRSSSWLEESAHSNVGSDDSFKRIEEKGGGLDEEWATGEGFKAWSFSEDEEEEEGKLFDLRGGGELALQNLDAGVRGENLESRKSEQQKQLEEEEKIQRSILEGTHVKT